MIIKECRYKESGCFELERCLLSDNELDKAVRILNEGGVVVFPTDTLYGLGVDPYNTEAVDKVFEIKNRRIDDPISVSVLDAKMLEDMAVMTPRIKKVIDRFIPGPLTLVLESKEKFPRGIMKDGKVGFRVPKHPLPIKIIRRFGPVTSTSANLTGRSPPMNAVEVLDQLGEGPDLIFDCGRCHYGQQSTVLDLTGEEVRVIREGVVRADEISRTW